MKGSPIEIGAAFRARRRALGLTQAEAAAQAAMSPTTWRKLEATGDVTATTWRAAALVLDWPISAHLSLAAGVDPSRIADTPQPEAIDRVAATKEIEALLHRTDLDPQAIELAMSVIQRLMDF